MLKSAGDHEKLSVCGGLKNSHRVDHMNKWYMHNPESVLENDTHKLL